jgi:hypothetical protein
MTNFIISIKRIKADGQKADFPPLREGNHPLFYASALGQLICFSAFYVGLPTLELKSGFEKSLSAFPLFKKADCKTRSAYRRQKLGCYYCDPLLLLIRNWENNEKAA